MRFFRRKRLGDDTDVDAAAADEHDGPFGFGYKSAWLAIPTTSAPEVAEALGLASVRTCGWAAGLRATRPDRGRTASVFVTPSIDGWALAVLGHGLEEDTARGRIDFAELSRRFGEAQKFASHRVVEYHEWQRWVAGEPMRRYCYLGESGEVLFDDGVPAPAEGTILRRHQLDELLRPGSPDEAWDEVELADEDTVMRVAAEWSIDPTQLGARRDVAGSGLVGELPT